MRLIFQLVLLLIGAVLVVSKVNGRPKAPKEARLNSNPLAVTRDAIEAGKIAFQSYCSPCHGEDGKARGKEARRLRVRPTNLSNRLIDARTDGELYWVITHGIDDNMPGFGSDVSETQRWQVVMYVRDIRKQQRDVEISELGPYKWDLPEGFPYPRVPADNLMTEEKVELGRYLFYDTRLSLNQTQSCATCHQQKYAFADGHGRGVGSTGEVHPRGPMSLVNVAYSPVLTWANPNMHRLETQALVPMFGEDPIELGMSGQEALLLERLRAEPVYRKLFPAAFPDDADPFTVGNVTKAIASFERTIVSAGSPYDLYQRGEDLNAISELAKRGEQLFFTERLDCFHCHGGINFYGPIDYYGKIFPEQAFHNTGLYNLAGKFSYPEPNLGLYSFTEDAADIGKFKAPTLRNIAVTAPYMHDGSIATLNEVIDHYAVGGRSIEFGPDAGEGSKNSNKSQFVKGFSLTPQEKRDIMAFLDSLTDSKLLLDPKLSNPW